MRFPCHFWVFDTENDIENAFDSETHIQDASVIDPMRFPCHFWVFDTENDIENASVINPMRFPCHFWVFDTENDIENAFDSETHIQAASVIDP
jgi:hypothetical protein